GLARADARDHDPPLRGLHVRLDRLPRSGRRRRLPRAAGRPLLRPLPRRGGALAAARRPDVARRDWDVRVHDRARERDRRERAAGAAVPLLRLPRRERRPALAPPAARLTSGLAGGVDEELAVIPLRP